MVTWFWPTNHPKFFDFCHTCKCLFSSHKMIAVALIGLLLATRRGVMVIYFFVVDFSFHMMRSQLPHVNQVFRAICCAEVKSRAKQVFVVHAVFYESLKNFLLRVIFSSHAAFSKRFFLVVTVFVSYISASYTIFLQYILPCDIKNILLDNLG